MSKNNYFYYTDHHYEFLYYLMSFAMEQYQDEDPLLSDCAKDLIRYILGMEETENVVVTKLEMQYVTVNNEKMIGLNDKVSFEPWPDMEEDLKDTYFLCYNPLGKFSIERREGVRITYLSMVKLREICEKYPSKNPIFLHYIQFLDEEMSGLQTTLNTPIEQWQVDDYRRFILHLVEDSVINSSRRIEAFPFVFADLRQHYLNWYYVSDSQLESMGVQDYIKAIFLQISSNVIDIGFQFFHKGTVECKTCEKKLMDFRNNISPMLITFDLSNYKEKIQYAESVVDRLTEEFRI